MNTFNAYFAPKGQLTGAIMPMCIYRKKGLSLGAKNVYSLLVNFSATGAVYAFPSQAYLAECLAVSIRSIQNYVNELVDYGLIEVRRGRFGTSPKYYFLNHPDLELKERANPAPVYAVARPGKGSDTTANISATPAKFAGLKYNNITKYNTPPLPPIERKPEVASDSGFDGGGGIFSSGAERDFWKLFNAYPRKENPAAALRVWMQYQMQGAMPPLDTLTAAVDANKRNNPTWTKEGGRYVPYLVNWLRDCRWNDEFSRPTHQMREQEGEAQAQSVGLYEIAEPGWCYLKAQTEANRRENALPGSAREETPEAIDPEFEAIWEACPFEPGPRVVSYGYWKALLKREHAVDTEGLLAAVSNASPDYNRQLWRFLDECIGRVE